MKIEFDKYIKCSHCKKQAEYKEGFIHMKTIISMVYECDHCENKTNIQKFASIKNNKLKGEM